MIKLDKMEVVIVPKNEHKVEMRKQMRQLQEEIAASEEKVRLHQEEKHMQA